MKLNPVYQEIVARMTYFKDKTKDSYPSYLAQVKAKHEYHDLLTRVSWDVLRCCFTPAQLCDWYDQYNCKVDENIDSIRTTWPDSKMYLIHKCSCDAEGEQRFTIHRLTEKSIRSAEIRKQDTINLVEATALRCQNDFYFIKAQHEFIRQDAKDYISQLSDTLQSIEI